MTDRSRWVDLDGPVHYADYGGEGTPLLLIHGLAGSSLNWMAVAPSLAETHRVLAVDLLGFGQTPLAGRKATLEANRRMVDRFLRNVIGEPAILVGNSMGGLISILEAAAEPARVRGLVLVNPAVPKRVGAIGEALVQGLFVSFLAPGVAELALATRGRMVEPEVVVTRILGLAARSSRPTWSRRAGATDGGRLSGLSSRPRVRCSPPTPESASSTPRSSGFRRRHCCCTAPMTGWSRWPPPKSWLDAGPTGPSISIATLATCR